MSVIMPPTHYHTIYTTGTPELMERKCVVTDIISVPTIKMLLIQSLETVTNIKSFIVGAAKCESLKYSVIF